MFIVVGLDRNGVYVLRPVRQMWVKFEEFEVKRNKF